MKAFISKTNKLSISVNSGIKDFYPIYLVPDDMAGVISNLPEVEDIGKLFDIDTIKNISSEIDADLQYVQLMRDAVISIRDNMLKQMNDLAIMQDRILSMINNVNSQQKDIDSRLMETAEISKEVMKVKLNGEEEANKFLTIINKKQDEITKSSEHLSERIRNEMRDTVNTIENTKENIEKRFKSAEQSMKNSLNEYTEKCNEAVNLAKKWASNPEGVPVDNGLFSAYHYAKLAEFNNIK